ncbi:hypothetical protein C8J57DRAFT_1254904 [Mycena rebaudengoi]|nr:hypothetical protein C8J57DRAFT_1254904 [Mycena rebaudengoi]
MWRHGTPQALYAHRKRGTSASAAHCGKMRQNAALVHTLTTWGAFSAPPESAPRLRWAVARREKTVVDCRHRHHVLTLDDNRRLETNSLLSSKSFQSRSSGSVSSEAAFQKITCLDPRTQSSRRSRRRGLARNKPRTLNAAGSSADFLSPARLLQYRDTVYAPISVAAARLAVNAATRASAATQENIVTVLSAAKIRKMDAKIILAANAERKFAVQMEEGAVLWGMLRLVHAVVAPVQSETAITARRKDAVPTEKSVPATQIVVLHLDGFPAPTRIFAVVFPCIVRDSNNVGKCRSHDSGNPPTLNPTRKHQPTTTTTHELTPTVTSIPTPSTGNIGSGSPTTTSSRTGPTVIPSAPAGSQNIVIDVTSDKNIGRALGRTWRLRAHLGPGRRHVMARTQRRSSRCFTDSLFTISVDGDSTDYGYGSQSDGMTPGNCTFSWSRTNLTPAIPHVVGIALFGSADRRRDLTSSAPFMLEVQNFVITQTDNNLTNTASTASFFGSDIWALSWTIVAIGAASISLAF